MAVVQAGNTAAMDYVTTDQLDTPRVITNSSQAVVWQWNSDPYGNGQPTGSLTYNLRFPGQYYDAETGHNYNYYRDYDVSIGRYVESDPIGMKGGINTYVYVTSNPIKNIDPRGLVKWTGTVSAYGVIYGGGAERFTFHLTSECIHGKQATVDVTAGGFAVGLGLEESASNENIEFEDNRSDVDPFVFEGESRYVDLGLVNVSFSVFQLGDATSIGGDNTNGVDLGVSGGAGISRITGDQIKNCGCQK